MFPSRTTLTGEQEAIVASSGDIKINAVAGSGKTTTLVEYAKRRKSARRILYLAFNRSVRQEAQRRFAEAGASNVDVQTAHSLAFRRMALPQGYRVGSGYKCHDLVRLLDIRPSSRDRLLPFVVANHVLRFAALFCNSDRQRVQELDYCSTMADDHARAAAQQRYGDIEHATRRFLALMDKKEIEVTHDFYLKKFQLSRPVLDYDIILFDEGQDASPVMLDVFLAQRAVKVIVGDVHQQIYGWRHAINALRRVDFANLSLTTSFRFNQHVADLAMECLRWKRHLGEDHEVRIKGVGTNRKVKTRATIARTNLALLKAAIDAVQHKRSVKKIYFEGNINSYTYANDGASIYDVLNLYRDERERIRDPLIGSMGSFAQLEDYADKAEDPELRMLIDIVNEYGAQIPALLKKMTAMHVADEDRGAADMIFSTLHKSKGMEYDSVTLANDFVTEDRIVKMLSKEKETPVDRGRLVEEINLAYVAVTRSRNFLDFPDGMFPRADKTRFAEAKPRPSFPKKGRGRAVPAYIARQRKAFGCAYAPWTAVRDRELRALHQSGMPIATIAKTIGRNPGAIGSRLRKLGLEDW